MYIPWKFTLIRGFDASHLLQLSTNRFFQINGKLLITVRHQIKKKAVSERLFTRNIHFTFETFKHFTFWQLHETNVFQND